MEKCAHMVPMCVLALLLHSTLVASLSDLAEVQLHRRHSSTSPQVDDKVSSQFEADAQLGAQLDGNGVEKKHWESIRKIGLRARAKNDEAQQATSLAQESHLRNTHEPPTSIVFGNSRHGERTVWTGSAPLGTRSKRPTQITFFCLEIICA